MTIIQALMCIGLPAPTASAPNGAAQLSVSKRITIDAPVAAVWASCGDFDGLGDWLAPVEKVTLTAGRNNEPGAVRHIDIKGGGYVDEELLDFDNAGHSFGYRILGGVLPVSDYSSTLRAKAVGPTQTEVTWSSTFKRKDTGSTPAADANDKAALDAISGLYEGGLDNLKKVVEGARSGH